MKPSFASNRGTTIHPSPYRNQLATIGHLSLSLFRMINRRPDQSEWNGLERYQRNGRVEEAISISDGSRSGGSFDVEGTIKLPCSRQPGFEEIVATVLRIKCWHMYLYSQPEILSLGTLSRQRCQDYLPSSFGAPSWIRLTYHRCSSSRFAASSWSVSGGESQSRTKDP